MIAAAGAKAPSPLRNSTFRTLFAAQIMSLLGIGLMTVALSLLAYRLGGANSAGLMLGAIFTLKMVAYVGFAPLAEAILARQPVSRTLVGLDIVRLALLVPMALAGSTWQIMALAFAFYAASAAFTPLYQATIPEVLPNEETYTSALALSRLAYTIEAMASPAIAGIALTFIAPPMLFWLAATCFAGSVAALIVARLPHRPVPARGNLLLRATRGLRIYLRTPRLRGLFLINLALSLGLAWVLVNTVVFAGLHLPGNGTGYTKLMTAYGAGAAAAALMVPGLLIRGGTERGVMISGGLLFAALTPVILVPLPLAGLLALWAGFGAASSLVLTPGGRVLARSAEVADRPAVFAAQFSLSHAGWLIAYPLAGWLGAALPLPNALMLLGAFCALLSLAALRVWPPWDPLERTHAHPELGPGDPHLREYPASGADFRHSHAFHIDERHPKWVT